MKSILCTFSQFSESDHAGLAGSKGEKLAKLYQLGYPVPDGFVILSTAFDGNGLKADAHNEVLTSFSHLIHSSPTQKIPVSLGSFENGWKRRRKSINKRQVNCSTLAKMN